MIPELNTFLKCVSTPFIYLYAPMTIIIGILTDGELKRGVGAVVQV